MVLAHQHDCPSEHLAEDHFFDFRRLQGVGNQHLHIVAPANDVDAFAGQLVHDVLNAISTDADARSHAVHALVRAADGDFGAVAGLAGNRADLDHAFSDLGNLLLEEPLNQLRLGAAEDHLDAASGFPDFIDGRPHALVGVMRLAGNLLTLGQDRLDVGQRDGSCAAFVSLDRSGHQLSLQVFIFVEQVVSLGLADLLDHHLLGGLRTDAFGNFLRRQRGAVVRPEIAPVRRSIDTAISSSSP